MVVGGLLNGTCLIVFFSFVSLIFLYFNAMSMLVCSYYVPFSAKSYHVFYVSSVDMSGFCQNCVHLCFYIFYILIRFCLWFNLG